MIDTLLRLLFPEYCYGCKKAGTALCPACHAALSPVKKTLNSPFIFSFYDYADPLVRRAVWELKYKRNATLAKALVKAYVPTLAPEVPFLSIVIIPMPQHYTKTWARGFNQSALLATWIQSLVPHATVAHLLKKIRSTIPQVQAQSAVSRRKNLQHSMVAEPVDPEKMYVIVDDVFTTGSTAQEASRVLRAAGATHIQIVTLARSWA